MGAPILPKVQRTTVGDLLTDLKAHYETTGQRTLREAETRLIPLRQFFTGRRANAISGDVLTAYIQHRQAAGLANGTINRELSVLGHGLQVGPGAREGDTPPYHSLTERGETTARIL